MKYLHYTARKFPTHKNVMAEIQFILVHIIIHKLKVASKGHYRADNEYQYQQLLVA